MNPFDSTPHFAVFRVTLLTEIGRNLLCSAILFSSSFSLFPMALFSSLFQKFSHDQICLHVKKNSISFFYTKTDPRKVLIIKPSDDIVDKPNNFRTTRMKISVMCTSMPSSCTIISVMCTSMSVNIVHTKLAHAINLKYRSLLFMPTLCCTVRHCAEVLPKNSLSQIQQFIH